MASELTIEQFKAFVDETFPDNNSRAIAERDFRDGLSKMADFVFTTNSTAFIQESITQINTIKGDAVSAAGIAGAYRDSTNTILSQAQFVKLAIDSTKSQIDSLLIIVQQLIAQGFNVKGNWVIATNTPNIGTISKANGDAYVVLDGGTTSITGTAITMVKGDAVTWSAADSKWIYRPSATIPADQSVSPSKLITWMGDLFTQLPEDSIYKLAMVDAVNRLAFAIRKDGYIEGRFVIEAISMMANAVHTASIQSNAVTLPKLSADVRGLLNVLFDSTNSDYFFLLMDAVNRIGFAVEKDGTVYIPKIKLPARSIPDSWLSQSLNDRLPTAGFNRLNKYNANDLDVETDRMWRGAEVDMPVKTETIGYLFTQIPRAKTSYLKGLNNIGSAIQFIQTNDFALRGKRYRGEFDPTVSGIVGLRVKGDYGNAATNSYPAFPAGVAGDAWVINCGNVTATKTANGLTFKNGDLLVKTADAYAIQPGPGDGTFQPGDFWDISSSGIFNGINLVTTGRIYFLDFRTGGDIFYARYLPSKAGEFFVKGECDPATFAPVAPKNGDAWVVSTAGSTQGLVVSVGDYIFYEGGFGVIEGKMKTIANGSAFYLPCNDASEWSVRRADKSNVLITINMKMQWATIKQRVSDDLWILSDSMAGINGTGTKLGVLSGRNVDVRSYSGSTSNQELAMLRYQTQTGDPVIGKTTLCWHGQNNIADVDQIKRVAYEVYRSLGVSQKRILFISVLGTRTASWNGSRIVIANNEDAFAGTNNIAQVEAFYDKTFPTQYINVRKALLAAAVGRTTPDTQFPGMTEEQVAATYHIVPRSFYNESTLKPVRSTMNFVGYHSAAGLPSGGNNLDYYIRTGNGLVGQDIINIGGVWTEFVDDNIHLSDAGAAAFASIINSILISKNI